MTARKSAASPCLRRGSMGGLKYRGHQRTPFSPPPFFARISFQVKVKSLAKYSPTLLVAQECAIREFLLCNVWLLFLGSKGVAENRAEGGNIFDLLSPSGNFLPPSTPCVFHFSNPSYYFLAFIEPPFSLPFPTRFHFPTLYRKRRQTQKKKSRGL